MLFMNPASPFTNSTQLDYIDSSKRPPGAILITDSNDEIVANMIRFNE